MIIINTPYINIPAGVSSHYKGLRPYFSKEVIYNQCITSNYLKRKLKTNNQFVFKFVRLLCFAIDALKLSILLITHRHAHILFNPSFGSKALQRELSFAKIAMSLNVKYSIFIHGWTKEFFEDVVNGEKKISDAFYHADSYFVLANQFAENLKRLGVKGKIYITTTKVPDSMISNFHLKKKDKVNRILYLARVEKDKGIFETIETFKLLHGKYPQLQFDVVGSGTALEEAKIASRELGDCIHFYGALSGNDLIKAYERADIYILLSYHEGMPTSVLEAMAFGLPVITRPVGGLVDFFENGKMGYMEDSLDSKVFAEKISYIVDNISIANSISCYNHRYAIEHFLASQIALSIEKQLSK